MALTRRELLKYGAAGTLSLLLPIGIGARAAVVSQAATPPELNEINDWIWVSPDNQVVIGVSQCEVGQGIYTGLASVVAAEMDADWEQVSVRFVTGRDAYRQSSGGEPFPQQFVAASTSMTQFWERTRLAGAQARDLFIRAAARYWQVDAATLRTHKAEVLDDAHRRRVTYGQLIPLTRELTLNPRPHLKSRSEEQQTGMIGTALPRVDTPEKVDGSALFGIDIALPEMLTAVPWMGPSLNGKVGALRNETEIRAMPGVVDLILSRHWSTMNMVKRDPDLSPNTVLVVAKSFWQAKKAAEKLDVEWIYSEKDNFSSQTLNEDNQRALNRNQPIIATDRGDAPGTIAAAKASACYHEARYQTEYVTHATLEPCNGTCLVEPNQITVWGPFQGQDLTRIVLAKMFGLKPEDVTLNNTLLGGSYGRKYLPDAVMHAATASKATGKPVKVIYPRAIDIRHGYYRPGELAHYQAVLKPDGYPQALRAHCVGHGLFAQLHQHRVEELGGWDETMVECLYNTRYAIPELRVENTLVPQPISLSFLRGVGSVASLFCLESFISELSDKAGIDEYQYRYNLLHEAPEMQRVLKATADAANWSTPLPDNHYRGLAVNIWVARDEAFVSYVALALEIAVNGSDYQVTRAVCGIDCGKVINPNLIRCNIEGGIGFALTGAWYSHLHFEQGGVVESNFDDYGLLQLHEMPEIEVVILESDRPPQGCGEVSTAVVAPALASALRKATGRPWRELPLPRRLSSI
jgi:isoquinoline 1-oxidoreductase beta subunit